jgi:hypothetical protein
MPSYLQPDIVKSEFADFPEFDTLLALAVEGARVMTPTDWTPNCGRNVTVRPNATRMAAPIHVRFAQEQALGDVILVNAEAFRAYADSASIAFNVCHLGGLGV